MFKFNETFNTLLFFELLLIYQLKSAVDIFLNVQKIFFLFNNWTEDQISSLLWLFFCVFQLFLQLSFTQLSLFKQFLHHLFDLISLMV